MKYLMYLFIANSHFNQAILQWTSFSLEVIVSLMLQRKEIGHFLINKFQNILSGTCKQSITLKNMVTWMTQSQGCGADVSFPVEPELKSPSFFSFL